MITNSVVKVLSYLPGNSEQNPYKSLQAGSAVQIQLGCLHELNHRYSVF